MTSDVATDQPTRKHAPQGDAESPGDTGTARPEPRGWAWSLARFGFRDRPPTSLRERLVPSYTDNSAYTGGGWLPCILVTLLAGFIRFWNLGKPKSVIFDETYYAKDAWSLLKLGYEGTWPKEANDQILAGNADSLQTQGSYIVHPPIGKWTIALGEQLFGLTPFGWRFALAVLGTLSVLMLCRIGRRLFRSTLLGCIAGLLMALDGLHFVMSRTSLLDLVLMFWILAAFGALLIDRDDTRALAARMFPDGPDAARAARMKLGLRPWRIVAGICLGLACGTKWSGVYVLAAFGILTVLWDAGTRRACGARRPYRATLRHDVLFAFLSTVAIALGIYIWSWTGWFLTDNGYFRHWADDRAGLSPDHVLGIPLPQFGMTWVPAPLRSLWHYHAEMWSFHTGLDSPHPYQSNPWSWLVLGRPVAYYFETVHQGTAGCTEQDCYQTVLGIGTPLLWWTGVVAVGYLLFRWAGRRDWRAGAILCGLAAAYLPWMAYQQRTIFLFYAVAFVPFLCLAVTMMLGALLGPPGATERRRAWGTAGVVAIIALIAWNFLYFYPIFTGETITRSGWLDRMWFSTWI
ncbi:dolichyl-phosphate-mannose--protein mannosyltransferase [Embleya sp. MST-111070]|uniref:dolichyl-phosphate-mannose--protein mannosyltransferase n=1 Tax=Embleya sp. MST-111070 TaxID=3398231 RepID=UPI003F737FD9